jgi:hypothetical protein
MTRIIVDAARIAVRVAAAFAMAFTIGPLAHQLPAGASERPFWNGHTPWVWTSEVAPVCSARLAGQQGLIRPGDVGPVWVATCLRDGREFAWGQK